MTPRVIDSAVEIAKRRGLRVYDCVQLAAALVAQEALTDLVQHLTDVDRSLLELSALVLLDKELSALGQDLTLLTADHELIAAAQAEGLTVDNPNDHPD